MTRIWGEAIKQREYHHLIFLHKMSNRGQAIAQSFDHPLVVGQQCGGFLLQVGELLCEDETLS